MSESNKERNHALFGGLILIVVGVILLGERYDWFGLNIDIGLGKIWPVFVIIAGIYLILTHRQG
jgi:hypothetical protein